MLIIGCDFHTRYQQIAPIFLSRYLPASTGLILGLTNCIFYGNVPKWLPDRLTYAQPRREL